MTSKDIQGHIDYEGVCHDSRHGSYILIVVSLVAFRFPSHLFFCV